MTRNRTADLVVQLVNDPALADQALAVIADQVLDATGAADGDVATVSGGTWVSSAPAVAPAGSVTDVTDSTGGTADGVLAALAGVGSPNLLSGAAAQDDVNARLQTINDNLADIASTLNTLLAELRTAGIIS